MAGALVLLNIAIVLTGVWVRYGPRDLDLAAGFGVSRQAWWAAMGLTAGASAVLGAVCRGRLNTSRARWSMLQLAVFPAFFGFQWFFLPAYPKHWEWWHYVVLAALSAVIAVGLWDDRRRGVRWGLLGAGRFVPAARRLVVPVVVLAGGLLAAGMAAGHSPPWSQMVCPLLTYPLYAYAQLLVFLGFLVPRLRDTGTSRTGIVLTSAGLFALLHWPNWLLVGACAVGAFVWTWVYVRLPSLPAAALAMGLLATAYKGFLPDGWQHNLRTGPIYVQRQTDARDREEARQRRRARRRRAWQARQRRAQKARSEQIPADPNVSPSRTSGGESR
jgi:hypothetical protein